MALQQSDLQHATFWFVSLQQLICLSKNDLLTFIIWGDAEISGYAGNIY